MINVVIVGAATLGRAALGPTYVAPRNAALCLAHARARAGFACADKRRRLRAGRACCSQPGFGGVDAAAAEMRINGAAEGSINAWYRHGRESQAQWTLRSRRCAVARCAIDAAVVERGNHVRACRYPAAHAKRSSLP